MSASLRTPDGRSIGPIRASHIGDLISLAEETGLSPWTAGNYLDELRNPRAIMLRLAGDDNATVGFIVGRMVAGSDEPRPDAEIYNIAVRLGLQRHGHGQALLDAFVSVCRGRAVAAIWLEVRESNSGAIRFYAQNGFKHVQTRNNFYENPRENGCLMQCILRY